MFTCNNSTYDRNTDSRSLWWQLPIMLIAVIVITAVPSFAASQSSARSVAMGGAFTALSRGVDAARNNPANLALSDNKGINIEVIGAGASIQNNAFSLNDYNKYTGAILTTSDKQYLLDQIPDEGLELNAELEASLLSVSASSFALTVTGVGVADVSLSRDIFDLVLNGNTFTQSIDVTGSYFEAVSYVAVGLSYGFPLMKISERELTGGATVKYLRGLAVERVTELRGSITTSLTGFSGDGQLIAQTATGGSGYAIDLGLAYALNKDYTLGLNFKNLLSKISWNKNTEEQGYVFNLDTLTLSNSSGDFYTSNSYTDTIADFSTSLTPVMSAGIAKTTGKFIWAFDWEQGFRRAYGVSTKPRLALGAEYKLVSALPLRAGYAIGGGRNPSLSLGSGFQVSGFHLDFAAITGSSISSGSSKGINFAFSTGITF